MPLSAAQLRQRAKAALKAGHYSAAKFGPLQAVLYDRLLRRCTRSSGRTSLRTRLAVRKVAYYRAKIALAEAWLDEQADPLFADRAKGEMHPMHDRIDEWQSAEARYLAQLPDEIRRRPTFSGPRRR
jgi:hypothetical protein